MNIFNFISKSLLTAGLAQVACQLFKLGFYSLRDGKFKPKYLAAAGGMPSAHSAFVTALAVSIGMNNGFNSEYFAIAFVFSLIIIHDSFRVRGAIEEHSRLLEDLTASAPKPYRAPEKIGHTSIEMLVGVVAGGTLAFLINFFFFR